MHRTDFDRELTERGRGGLGSKGTPGPWAHGPHTGSSAKTGLTPSPPEQRRPHLQPISRQPYCFNLWGRSARFNDWPCPCTVERRGRQAPLVGPSSCLMAQQSHCPTASSAPQKWGGSSPRHHATQHIISTSMRMAFSRLSVSGAALGLSTCLSQAARHTARQSKPWAGGARIHAQLPMAQPARAVHPRVTTRLNIQALDGATVRGRHANLGQRQYARATRPTSRMAL